MYGWNDKAALSTRAPMERVKFETKFKIKPIK